MKIGDTVVYVGDYYKPELEDNHKGTITGVDINFYSYPYLVLFEGQSRPWPCDEYELALLQ